MKKNLRNGPLMPENKIKGVLRGTKLFFLITVWLLYASSAFALSQQRITMNLAETPIKQVLNEFQRQTGKIVIYSSDKLETSHKINAHFQNAELETFLNTVLAECGMSWRIEGDYVMIVPISKKELPQQQKKEVTLTGRVTDTDGNPLPGVTVIIKGTTVGVTTQADGKFVLKTVEMEDMRLTFTFVGMKLKEIKASYTAPMNVVLEEDVKEIEEVVVNGYFNRSKESYTGAQITVKAEDMQKVGALNVIQALNAFDPSIRLNESLAFGSDPNRVPDITVRGENGFDLRESTDDALTNPNRPLYILDGVEVSPTKIYDMDMNRVDQVSILKDASATALYGSRGANGVIVVTTIRPKSGQIRVTANANFNVSIPDLRDYNMMDAAEKLEYEWNAYYRYYADPKNTEDEAMKNSKLMEYNKKLEEVRRGVNTYWLAQPLQRSLNQRYNLNFEGGDQHFRYGINLRYDTDKGVMIGSGREKYGIDLVFNYNLGENFFIRNDVLVDNVKGTDSPYGLFSNWVRQNPYDRIYDEDGDFVTTLSSGDQNPMINSSLSNFDFTTYLSVQDNFNIDWLFLKSFRLQGRFSYTKRTGSSEIFKGPSSSEFKSVKEPEKKGSYEMSHNKSDSFDGNVTLSYFKTIDKGTLNLGAGVNMTQSTSTSDIFQATGFANDHIDFVGAATRFKENAVPGGTYDKSRLVGFFVNLNYGWDSRYFLDVSYRTDGSSKFGRESRFAPFWSVGVAWNVHKEKFWTGDVKNAFKIRASVGTTGATNFSSSQALTIYKYDFKKEYNGYYGVDLKGYGNPRLKWQSTDNYNAGIDLTLWHGRITLNADAYYKKTRNLLSSVDIVPSTGFNDYVENVGQLKNVGFEGRVRVNIIDQPNDGWKWNVAFSAFHNKSKITRLSSMMERLNESTAVDEKKSESSKVPRIYEVGRSLSALMLVESAGIDPATGNELYIKRDGTRTFEYDGRDRVVVGDIKPKVEGTVNSTLTWKGFNLYIQFRYEVGAKAYNETLASKIEGTWYYYNADRRALYERWKNPGDEVVFRRIDDTSTPRQTTRLMFDNNIFSMESLSLAYTLPVKYARMLHTERIRAQISTTDLFRLSTIKQERGTDYPFARTFTAGLSITF